MYRKAGYDMIAGTGILMAFAIMTIALCDVVWFYIASAPRVDVLEGNIHPTTRTCLAHGDMFQVWEEYQNCTESLMKNGSFRSHLMNVWETKVQMPWMNPPGCAVLVEFRPLDKQIRRSVQNALDNLPVSWCIHVAGSAAVLDLVQKAFPLEILVQKVCLLDLEKQDMSQVMRHGGEENCLLQLHTCQ